ncbi:hypothetical protein COX08_03765 [Candidatus Beckwithbacteria bacterium CG23_combo_of_CG06-09_8_20_14_all_34_8]|uniref:Uncharacterized protein n=1 Tax=Candidatus Beckwithbacteria bacterium CG23_combo_of_CG06-09_8_20_14_all_34_8 TaxID=1974497 RepID=A0A2H0B5M1_9BACT|nr:MAG: hypothetical protein COX08_03765 [Candidatus Beckwithbacteria bacterium CG23_combo_of_CG06-09_8_20_14_all_34_8]
MFFNHKKTAKTKIDYLILIIGFLATFIFYFIFNGQQIMQAGIVICAGLFYTLWGSLHHQREGDFHPKIALEYFLMASLAVVVLLSIIFRI